MPRLRELVPGTCNCPVKREARCSAEGSVMLGPIAIHLLSQSIPIVRENVVNAYTKDGLYCLLLVDLDGRKFIEKYPLVNIFRVREY